MGNWTPWLAPIGLPKITRAPEYATAFSVNQRPSPIDSEATSTRSAFMPERMYENPLPSSPTRLSAGISMSSKNSALVEWFIIMRSGRISSPFSPRMSTRKTLSPSVRRATCSTGVVRASSSMRSDCCAREMNILRPLTT